MKDPLQQLYYTFTFGEFRQKNIRRILNLFRNNINIWKSSWLSINEEFFDIPKLIENCVRRQPQFIHANIPRMSKYVGKMFNYKLSGFGLTSPTSCSYKYCTRKFGTNIYSLKREIVTTKQIMNWINIRERFNGTKNASIGTLVSDIGLLRDNTTCEDDDCFTFESHFDDPSGWVWEAKYS